MVKPSVPTVDIDPHSGFCFGVTAAINKAEEELHAGNELFCLGDIVHNSAEMKRLADQGLKTITHDDLNTIGDTRVLLRAHGEPPSTYKAALSRNITIVDATCPVVLKLQQRIKKDYDMALKSGKRLQIVIYGMPGHAEVNGLVGQTEGNAIVIEDAGQLDRIDFAHDISLYSQTTKSVEGFTEIINEIRNRLKPGVHFHHYDSICRQVANRVEGLKKFASTHDVVLFVAGEKSSNGKVLFNHCLSVNPRSYLLAGPDSITLEQLADARSIGICGATSTPRWLMEEVAETVKRIKNV